MTYPRYLKVNSNMQRHMQQAPAPNCPSPSTRLIALLLVTDCLIGRIVNTSNASTLHTSLPFDSSIAPSRSSIISDSFVHKRDAASTNLQQLTNTVLPILVLGEQSVINLYESIVLPNGTLTSDAISGQKQDTPLASLLNLAAIRLTLDYINQQHLLPGYHLAFKPIVQLPKNVADFGISMGPLVIGSSHLNENRKSLQTLSALCGFVSYLDLLVINPGLLTAPTNYCPYLYCRYREKLSPMSNNSSEPICRQILTPDELTLETTLSFIADVGKWARVALVMSSNDFGDLNEARILHEAFTKRNIDVSLVVVDQFEDNESGGSISLEGDEDYPCKNATTNILNQIKSLDLRVIVFQMSNVPLTYKLLTHLYRLGITGPRYVFILPTSHSSFLSRVKPPLFSVKLLPDQLEVDGNNLAKQLRFTFFIGTVFSLDERQTSVGEQRRVSLLKAFVGQNIEKSVEPADSWPLYRDAVFELVEALNQTDITLKSSYQIALSNYGEHSHLIYSILSKQIQENSGHVLPLPVYVARWSFDEKKLYPILRTTQHPITSLQSSISTSSSTTPDTNSSALIAFPPVKLQNMNGYFIEAVPSGSANFPPGYLQSPIWQTSNALSPKHGPDLVETVDEVRSNTYGIVISCAAFLAVIDSFLWLNPWLLRLQGRKHKTMLLGGSILVPGCLFLDAAAVCFATPIAASNGILCAFDVIFTVTGLSLLHGISIFRLALSGRKTHKAWLLLSHSSQVLFCCRFMRIHNQQQQQQQAQQQTTQTIDVSQTNDGQTLTSFVGSQQLQASTSSNQQSVFAPFPTRYKRQSSYSYLSSQAKQQLAVIGTIWFTLLNAIIVTFWFSTDLIHLETDSSRNSRSSYNEGDDVIYRVKLMICTSAALGWWLMALGIVHAFLLATGCSYAITLWYENQLHPIPEYNRLSLAAFSQMALLFAAFITLLSSNRPPSTQHAILAFICLGFSSTGAIFLRLTKSNPINNAIQQIMLRGGLGQGQGRVSSVIGANRSGQQDMAFSFVRRLQAVEILTPITEEARSQSTPKKMQSRSGSQNGSTKTIIGTDFNAAITNVIASNTPSISGTAQQPIVHSYQHSRANSSTEYINSSGSNNSVFVDR